MNKQRLDKIILSRRLVPSREIAQSLILRGDVLVNDTPVTKAGAQIREDAQIRIRGELPKYVSRGGDKLEGALSDFALDVSGLIALDLGASTGGFTDCLLQHGAIKVYAVDVGTAQLAEKLRQDPRVVSLEQTHAKELPSFDPAPSLAAIDVSFIGLRKVLPFVFPILTPPWKILALVKPQFELGPECVQEGGVVPEESMQLRAVFLVEEFIAQNGFVSKGYSSSRLKGGRSGNQEYFLLIADK
jgi:23S rRNA (cytidine1920-2'-O)/16S rRNA (cytidine1409-2'-O)-methyltransferase